MIPGVLRSHKGKIPLEKNSSVNSSFGSDFGSDSGVRRMTMYKVLDKNLRSMHGGIAQWAVGERMEVHGELAPCKNGIHVCRDERDLLTWLGQTICPVIECSDEHIDADDKRVVRWAVIGEPNPHWNERTARHFACDCAEYALRFANRTRSEPLQACIDTARAYADWPEEWDAARDAARAATWAKVDADIRVAKMAAAQSSAMDDIAAILATYLNGTSEWVV